MYVPARRQVAVSVPRGNNNGVTRNYADAVRDNNVVLGRLGAPAPFNRPTRDRPPAHALPWPVLGTPSTIVRLVIYRCTPFWRHNNPTTMATLRGGGMMTSRVMGMIVAAGQTLGHPMPAAWRVWVPVTPLSTPGKKSEVFVTYRWTNWPN
jgi:hypothetical protein